MFTCGQFVQWLDDPEFGVWFSLDPLTFLFFVASRPFLRLAPGLLYDGCRGSTRRSKASGGEMFIVHLLPPFRPHINCSLVKGRDVRAFTWITAFFVAGIIVYFCYCSSSFSANETPNFALYWGSVASFSVLTNYLFYLSKLYSLGFWRHCIIVEWNVTGIRWNCLFRCGIEPGNTSNQNSTLDRWVKVFECLERWRVVTPRQVSFGWSGQEDWDGQDMWHEWGEERCIQGFSGETWGEETTWKTQA
jgi:hypothetical protein